MRKLVLLFYLCLWSGQFTLGQSVTEAGRSRVQTINFDSLRAVANRTRGAKTTATESIFGTLAPDSSRYHALIICNQAYSDDAWPTLRWPIRDGEKLRDVLQKRYKFDQSDIRLLTNPTRSELFAVLQQYQRKLTRHDNLLIFYAGHGYYDRDLNAGYWIPRDGDRDNPANWFANDELKRILRATNTQHTLVIADACFAGTLTRGGPDPVKDRHRTEVNWEDLLPESMLRSRYGLRSRKVMTSGALEQVPDQSTFIETLVWTLQTSTIRYLTAEQLFDRVKKSASQQTLLFTLIPDCGHETGGDFILMLR